MYFLSTKESRIRQKKESRVRQKEARNARNNRAEFIRALSVGQISRRHLYEWGLLTFGGLTEYAAWCNAPWVNTLSSMVHLWRNEFSNS
jgi:hypothetical protein